MHFVTSSIYKKATRLALSEGLDPDMLSHHQKSIEVASDAKYLPISLLWEVYEIADQNLKPGFSVRQGLQLAADDYGTLGMSWKTSWSAREILDRLERYMILVTDRGSININEGKGECKLTLTRKPMSRGMEMSNETSIVMIINVLQEVTGKPIKPISVSFDHKIPDTSALSTYFNCHVVDGHLTNEIHFKSADLETPTLKADRTIHEFLVERMEEESQGIIINANKLIKDVQTLIEEALPSGIPSVIQIADHLGMGARTLKRRLSDHGFTFRDLVQKSQEEISTTLLKTSERSIGEIAFQTGFSEQSAFNRAFKRWTDQSPVEYRKNA